MFAPLNSGNWMFGLVFFFPHLQEGGATCVLDFLGDSCWNVRMEEPCHIVDSECGVKVTVDLGGQGDFCGTEWEH